MGVRFTVDGEPKVIDCADGIDPQTTLLQWLRASGRVGTKEGCAEGECGACAVGVVAPDARGRLALHPVNSCLLPLFGMAGYTVITSEGIATGGDLHPVQVAMVDQGGSQCGYCTPGFVVSLFCEYYRPDRAAYDPEAIGGNLCRCTGYRPIAAAARSMPAPSADDPWLRTIEGAAPAIEAFEQSDGETRFVRPTSLPGVFDALAAFPGAMLIAGGTDVMVAANQRFARWPALVALDAVADLRRIERSDRELTIGSAVPLSHLEEWMHGVDGIPLLRQLLPLFSSRLIRNRATLGGNLATASPIGDSPPVLLALDADVTLARAGGSRRLPLREFFLTYRKTALAPGEIIEAVHVPLRLLRHQRFYKVSKRVLDDISTVAAAFALDLDPTGQVKELRVAYGGVAATPLRVTSVERLAAGKPWSAGTLGTLVEEIERVGTPMSDHRGSAAYRRAMMRKLLERFYFETHRAAGGAP
jgi:xanthine dehydrogenase small subunit